jgi:hypothetical protein
MGIGFGAKEEVKGVFPIPDHAQLYRLRHCLQGVLDKKDIVWVIVREQNMHMPSCETAPMVAGSGALCSGTGKSECVSPRCYLSVSF